MKAHFSQVHWGRVVLTGVLVAILVILLSIVLFLLLNAFHVWDHLDQGHLAFQVFSWISNILAILLTAFGAVRVARKVERAAPLHGFLVGLVAALIVFGPGFAARLDLATLVPFVLMLAAGWLGGVLGSRGREQS